MTSLTKITPGETFRAKSKERLIDAANMTLHQLVDEFQRLSAIIDDGVTEDEHGRLQCSEEAELAKRERDLVRGVSKARFAIDFYTYDRAGDRLNDLW